MSGNLLSACRTAAVPGVGVKNLAVRDAKVLGILGLRVINTTAVETFAALRPSLDTLKIKGQGKSNSMRLGQRNIFISVTIRYTFHDACGGCGMDGTRDWDETEFVGETIFVLIGRSD